MAIEPESEAFLVRIDPALARLEKHTHAAAPNGALTSPDEETAEQWDVGQVWAHLAEFVDFWVNQIQGILAQQSAEPVPFGRTKTDESRVGSIEQHRHDDIPTLYAELSRQVVGLKALLEGMSADDWTRQGRHQKLGDMSMQRIFEFFLVGHLEEHADQLDELAAGGAP